MPLEVIDFINKNMNIKKMKNLSLAKERGIEPVFITPQ
jgi:hypothetical protein